MLEFPDKGSWLLKKRELAVSYRMESEEASKKRKCHEQLTNDNLLDRAEASSFEQKKRRFSTENSTNMNHNNIDEGYHHNRMSLDLELNLSPYLIDLNHHDDHDHDHDLSNYNKKYEKEERKKIMETGSVLGLKSRKSMAWVAFDLDDGFGGKGGGGKDEMVARVCMKCHMLVMLCKASPACPNCKFMHSPDDTSISLLFTPKPTLLA